jgi:hypothetical protein
MKSRRLIWRGSESAGAASESAASEGDGPPEGVPLGGTNAETMQRLQVGLFGLGSMVLLVGLASVLGNQADRIEQGAVPDAAPTTEPVEAEQQRDPLADAGIVPDIPDEPSPNASPAQPEGAAPPANATPQP